MKETTKKMNIVRKTLLGLGAIVLAMFTIVLLMFLPKKILFILNIMLKTIFFLIFAYCVGAIITELK